MEITLTGRAAIVTGGSKGIGLAVATQFASSGADVAIMARGREALDQAIKRVGAAAKGASCGIQGDVAIAADIDRAYNEAMKGFGKIDIVVNNAGTSRTGAFEESRMRSGTSRPRSEIVRRHQAHPPGMAADEGAALGTDDQRAQHRGKGATAEERADLHHPRSRHGADQGACRRRRAHNVLVNALLVGFIEADQHVRARRGRYCPSPIT